METFANYCLALIDKNQDTGYDLLSRSYHPEQYFITTKPEERECLILIRSSGSRLSVNASEWLYRDLKPLLVISEGVLLHNKRSGRWRVWYPNGQLWREGNYENDKRTGHWREWYDNGQLQEEGDYVNGERSGHWMEWFDNGQLRSEGDYENGILRRWGREWYRNGKLLYQEYQNISC